MGLIFNGLFFMFFMIFINFIYYLIEIFFPNINFVTTKHIKDIIQNNNTIFKSVIIDEKNNYAYFYENITNVLINNPLYGVKISDKYSYENKLAEFYNSSNFNNLHINYEITKSIVSYIAEYILIFLSVYIILSFFGKLINTNSGFNLSSIVFPENGFQISKNVDTRFENVVGLKYVKQDLIQYIDMINNRKKYIQSGAKLPKGLLFTGPPGTGKTLLARALAGETGTSFISVSGSDFIELFAGVGAQRVRNLFKLARKYSPCIIFIDEIDAIGRKRTSGSNGGHSEQGQTINKLLCEMDGFNENDNIMIIAATNMKSVLDSALTRSGRFDRNIVFENPNINERKELFELYLNKIKLDRTIKDNLDDYCNKLAKMTGGLSGADIANISNQAIVHHLKNLYLDDLEKKHNDLDNDLDNIGTTFNDIEQSIDEVMVGMKKIERLMTDDERNIVAHHEAGHTLTAYLLKYTDPPVKVSIVPRGDASLGFSQQEPKDKKLYSKEEICDKICVCLGGRIAEEIIFGKITTGASDDIEKLTELAYSMVIIYGMSENLGIINYKLNEKFMHKISDSTKYKIDEEINTIIHKQYCKTKELLLRHRKEMIIIAKHLLETEVLFGDNIKKLIDKTGVLKNSI